MTLDEIITHRTGMLTGYQSSRLAKRYRKLVDQVRDAAVNGGYGEALPRSVAINYAKLLAVKEKYDSEGLFFVHHGVGSERWSLDGFTKLT